MSLKQKTVSGLLWSAIDQFSKLGITFITSILLARILTPREFGLIGMITVFIAVSESFINSGFSSALIRKKDCTDKDFSTVFYFNLVAGLLFFAILYFSAPAIAQFFNEPKLTLIVRVLGIVLIIDALTIIQRTILIKRINFKLQAKISVIAAIGSGVIAVYMAYNQYGVWSLVAQRISQQSLNSALLWLWNRWKPLATFSVQSFKELFAFGSKLLISGLIDTLYRNIYLLVIGKFFSAQDLGYYTKANEFRQVPSQKLTGIISRVSYPVLASIQDDKTRLKNNYRKLIRSTMFITFILMLGLAAVAEPMIITLIGEKWRPSIVFLQMLCFVGMMYPLHALNLNMLQVAGRSDLSLKLEIIKKIMAIPIIIIGIKFGITVMIAGMIINTQIAYVLNSYWSGKFIGYSYLQQVKDILPSFILAEVMAGLVFMIGILLPLNFLPLLIVQVSTGAGIIFAFCEITKFKDYIFAKKIVIEKIKEFRQARQKTNGNN